MLKLDLPEREFFDEETGTFFMLGPKTIQLEHSLVSLSKWESKWNKRFLGNSELTQEEKIDYIFCMITTQNVEPKILHLLKPEHVEAIYRYIDAPMTATTFGKSAPYRGKKENITSEIIYYWMISLGIPMECQKWHLNRLMTLIRVCNIKNSPQKKVSRSERAAEYRRLNAERRKRLNSNG